MVELIYFSISARAFSGVSLAVSIINVSSIQLNIQLIEK